jgi:hypothetical protein
MKNHIIAVALAICSTLHINGKTLQSPAKLPSSSAAQAATANKSTQWKDLWNRTKQALQPMSQEEQIKHHVNMILEWAKSKTKEELNQIKDSIQFLNPRPNDSDIMIEAKKIAKAQLFPAEKSYWEQYAPQFMQNAVTSTKNYIYYLTPQFIKNRLYPTSTMLVTRRILGTTHTKVIVDPEKMSPEELKKALELQTSTRQNENLKERVDNWIKSQNQ